ncbi:MAG: substrate-binding domain-containing protein [Rhodocyclaceae bacterium]
MKQTATRLGVTLARLGWPLGALVWLGLSLPACGAETVRIGGTGAGSVVMQRLAQEYRRAQPDAEIEVAMPPLSSGGGIRALAAGRLDLAVSGRPLKAEEAPMPGLGAAIEFARTPLAMASSGSAAADLSRKELADIYAGRTTQWRDGSPIRLILRSREESDTAALRKLSPEMSAAVDASYERTGLPTADNDLETMDLVVKIPGSLGPVTLGMARLDGRPIKLLSLDGVTPSAKNLESSKYPALKSLYLIVGAKPSPQTERFLAFLHGDKARRFLVEAGLLPVSKWPPDRASR